MTNVRIEVTRTGTENPLSTIKRFTKRVSSSGILKKARTLRYKTRPQSDYKRRQSALRRIAKRKAFEKLAKLGKVVDARRR